MNLRRFVINALYKLLIHRPRFEYHNFERWINKIDLASIDGNEFDLVLQNDDETPMEFVVEVLKKHVGMDEPTAIEAMIKVHKNGSCIVFRNTKEIIEEMESRISNDASVEGYPLKCSCMESS